MTPSNPLVIDVENVVTVLEGGKVDFSPFNPSNTLVSVGYAFIQNDAVSDISYDFFHHVEVDKPDDPRRLQAALDQCDCVVGHNVKHDALWLLESGFNLPDCYYDTMIGEYILLRSRKHDISLEGSCERRRVTKKKSKLVDEYMSAGVTFDRIPKDVVLEYGMGDIQSAGELYLAQQKLFDREDNVGLRPTLDLMNQFCHVLTDMERNGIYIDLLALDEVDKEFTAERMELVEKLEDIKAKVMGDTPINLDSPAQLSELIYSRRVKDKKAWARVFGLGKDDRGKDLPRPKMNAQGFATHVRTQTEKMYKTRAEHCSTCGGSGRIRKIKKDGTPFKKDNICQNCSGSGFIYHNLKEYAGLMMSPRNIFDVTANGFATSKETLEYLSRVAHEKGRHEAFEFLNAAVRYNAVDTYLNSFVGGIRRNVKGNILHPKFNQTVTSTGRLSSSDPNFQNQPRGKTFPIRRVVSSRFEGGEIMEADYAQLEFRCAGILSGDPRVAQDVKDKIDVHAFTAQTLTDAGQSTDRQGAKPHTFKPLYGGLSGTQAEQTYYRAFLDKYARVKQWHTELQNTAIAKKRIRIPTGREYDFPGAIRTRFGTSTFRTQICNYPVQGFATADIVPMACIKVWWAMKQAGVKSILCNTVHDSIVVDVFPGERETIKNILLTCMLSVKEDLEKKFGMKIDIPLGVEVKVGPNWLAGEVIATAENE